jgi:hypothetical protein
MHGSSVEYIVQIRVQDYWIDYGGGRSDRKFRYREDAEEFLEEVKKDEPNRDFQLIKRKHRFIDEVIE